MKSQQDNIATAVTKPSINRKAFELIAYLSLLVAFIYTILKADDTRLERVIAAKELRVLTVNSPTTYYHGAEDIAGIEYDLVLQFADYLGVELNIIVTPSINNITPLLNGNQADLAAAGLSITDKRLKILKFAPPYQTITPLIVTHKRSNFRPNTIEELISKKIEIIAGSNHEEFFIALKDQYPDFEWINNSENSIDDLLQRLTNMEIDAIAIDSNDFTLGRRVNPRLRIAFNLSDSQSLAWAFKRGEDDSLHQASVEFFDSIEQNGLLTQILERYYGHVEILNDVDNTVLLRDIQERLPQFEPIFRRAGEKYDIDPRLLAAIAYQESHWITDAVSPTGVRGIMMLTQRTAGQLNVRNRLDSYESIMGGAEYLQILKNKIPERIPEPDRTWMAIASYNVGFGHLEDARQLTQGRKKNPDAWIDVMETLPLLSQKKWYQKTKHGYARGREPVNYVQNIRSYYDVLVWLDERNKKPEEKFDPTTVLPKSL